METFSALLAICAGNSPVPGEFPTQRPVTRSFGVYFDLRPNKWLSKQSWGWWFETLSCSLWRHRNVQMSCQDLIRWQGTVIVALEMTVGRYALLCVRFGFVVLKTEWFFPSYESTNHYIIVIKTKQDYFLHFTCHLCRHFIRTSVQHADIKGRHKSLHPTDTVGCNYLSLLLEFSGDLATLGLSCLVK